MTLKLNGTNSVAAPAYAGDDADTGLQCGTDELKLVTGGTARATVDSSGNVGIGETNPAAKLHVESNTNDTSPGSTALVRFESTGVGTDAGIRFKSGTSTYTQIGGIGSTLYAYTGGSERLRIDSSGRLLVGMSSYGVNRTAAFRGTPTSVDNPGRISLLRKYSAISGNNLDAEVGRLCFADDNGDGDGADIRGVVDGTSWTTSSKPTRLVFSTTASSASSPTERMRITSDGRVTLTSDASGLLAGSATSSHLVVPAPSTNTGSVGIEGVTVSTSTRFHLSFTNPNGVVGSISTNGSATAFNTSSDYRLKENVVDIADGITRVKQLQPRRFNFIADADTTVDGFLAHEAQTVVPEAVTGTHNGVQIWEEGEELPNGVSVGDNKLDDDGNTIPDYQGIDQSKLVPLLTAALQEAIAKIETLEAKVAALEAAS